MFDLILAKERDQYEEARLLFQEYARSLDFSLEFQNFAEELCSLREMYGEPNGAIILAVNNEEYVGCIGLRQIENATTCEIKRMYVKPAYRGMGLGRKLIIAAIDKARELAYSLIKLDTLRDRMPQAMKLYQSLGFSPARPYNTNPLATAAYFEKRLEQVSGSAQASNP